MASMSFVYVALERIQPEQIFQHNKLSQAPNKKGLWEVLPIPPTGEINPLIPRGWSSMRACLEIWLMKEKNGCFRDIFSGLGDSSSPKISRWDSELPAFIKHSCSLMLVQDRPRGPGAVKDALLHLCYEQLNLKWALEISVFIFNLSNCWPHCRASKGCFLNGTQYLHTEDSQQGEVAILSFLKTINYWYYPTILLYQQVFLFTGGNKFCTLKRENVRNITGFHLAAW